MCQEVASRLWGADPAGHRYVEAAWPATLQNSHKATTVFMFLAVILPQTHQYQRWPQARLLQKTLHPSGSGLVPPDCPCAEAVGGVVVQMGQVGGQALQDSRLPSAECTAAAMCHRTVSNKLGSPPASAMSSSLRMMVGRQPIPNHHRYLKTTVGPHAHLRAKGRRGREGKSHAADDSTSRHGAGTNWSKQFEHSPVQHSIICR